MSKIVVFDSGLGSLSIIRPIQVAICSHIVYFADQVNFPYGTMSASRLRKIITERVKMLEERFEPEMVVIASNTPTLMLGDLPGTNTIGVVPPLVAASKATKTGNIAILATRVVSHSTNLVKYIRSCEIEKNKITIDRINCSSLVDLVESGEFITNKKKCSKIIQEVLHEKFKKNCIDVATLSSTHLPFLLSILQKEFPTVKFLDPAKDVAKIVKKSTSPSLSNRLDVYTSSNPRALEIKLARMGIKRRVSFLA